MNDLFLLIFLLSLVALIIGMIKPSLVVRWGNENKRDRKSVLKCYGITLIASFILFGITMENTNNTPSKSTNVQQKQETDQEKADKVIKLISELPTVDSLTLDNSEKVSLAKTAYDALSEKQKALITNVEGLTNSEKKINELKAAKEAEEKVAAEKAAKEAEEKAAAEKAAAEKAAAERAAAEAKKYDTGITYHQLARTPDDYKEKYVKFTGKVIQVVEGKGETNLRIAVNDDYDKIIFVGYDASITSVRVLEDDTVTIKGRSIGLYTYESTMGQSISIPGIYVDEISIQN